MQTIGEKLEEARKRRGISIREASEVTKIRSEYLANFENNLFDINLPEVYIRGFLRAYAQFLKLNGEKILTDYNARQLGETGFARPKESREFLGRMDIPADSKEAEQASQPAGPLPHNSGPAGAPKEESRFDYNNFDKATLIKGGAAIAAAGVLLVMVIFGVMAIFRSGSSETVAAEGPAGETVARQELTLTASGGDIDNVTVTEVSTGLQLFRGPLIDGQSQQVPFDAQVQLSYTHAQHLRLTHDGQQYQMGGRNIGRSIFPPTAP